MTTVKFRYWSDKNVSFKGEVDSGVEREDWDQMTGPEQSEVEADVMGYLIDLEVVDR